MIVSRLTRDFPRFKDELEVMKAICKDFWNAVFKKQVDNLRTNHQGVYVLQDNKFRFLAPISNNRQYLEQAPNVGFKLKVYFKCESSTASVAISVFSLHLWSIKGGLSQLRPDVYCHS